MTATISVYECDLCGIRAFTDGRCAQCGVSLHRIGIGGCCPVCDEPIAINELHTPSPPQPPRPTGPADTNA